MSTTRLWFALYTQPHKEYLVRDKLVGDGLSVFLPEISNRVQRADRRSRRPFFPHYLFLKNPGADKLAAVRTTPGLRQIVTYGGLPAGIPDEVIRHLRTRLKYYEVPDEDPFQPGEAVRIIGGPFEGMEAVFDRRLSGRDRVRVLIDFIGRVAVPVEMDAKDLLPPR